MSPKARTEIAEADAPDARNAYPDSPPTEPDPTLSLDASFSTYDRYAVPPDDDQGPAPPGHGSEQTLGKPGGGTTAAAAPKSKGE